MVFQFALVRLGGRQSLGEVIANAYSALRPPADPRRRVPARKTLEDFDSNPSPPSAARSPPGVRGVPRREADFSDQAEVIYAAIQRYEAECENRRRAASQRAFRPSPRLHQRGISRAAGYVDAIAAALADLQ
ncbi:MAG: hypothetical protein JWN20_1796 [Jatrophihabitantaceae bacterium]|nr:hypothetical protein [Jatrophihabitantaceae bacterium]